MVTRLMARRTAARYVLLIAVASLCSCSGDESSTADNGEVAKASPEPAARVEPATATEAPRQAATTPPVISPELPLSVPGSSSPSEEWLQRYANLDLDAVFEAISKAVRYEPYRGVLRGAAGTDVAQSGNSLDQSLLLAEVLRHNGFRVRFAQGRLTGANLESVLRGMYPPEIPDLGFGPDYDPYDPMSDPEVQSSAADHFWVEVYQPGNWLPLDPSFPRAVPGESYAAVVARHDAIPKDNYQTLRLSLKQELSDGTVAQLGSVQESVVNLGLRPISLIVHRVPKSSSEKEEKPRGTSRTLGGMGGSLGGGKPEPQVEDEVPRLVAVEHQRRLFINGAFVPWQGTLVAEQERDGFIKREWLELDVSLLGVPTVRTQRELYRHWPGGPKEPPAVRHYAISVIPGPITDNWLQAERARVAATLDLNKWQRELRKASNVEPGSERATSLAPTLREHGDLAGIAGGHLVGLTHATTSDELSRQIAWSGGVAMVWPVPRLLITSVETEELDAGGTESNITLDLRLDQVQAIPYPGVPAHAAKLFQMARGLQNTALEGTVLSRATGTDVPVTTAAVMIKAAADGTAVLTLSPSNASQISGIEGLPAHSGALITDALRGGHDIIIPGRPAHLGGRDRWGWWQVNRDTGEVIGVMDDGQHQATTNYSFSLSKVGLDDDSGFVIGGIIGANSTLFTISGLMLQYGEASPAMIADVEKYVKSIMCRSCPSKAGVSAGASAGVSAGNDCFSLERKKEKSIGVSASISFCESYQQGFSCASGMLLQGLTGSGGGGVSAGAQAGVSAQVNCEKAFGGIKIGN